MFTKHGTLNSIIVVGDWSCAKAPNANWTSGARESWDPPFVNEYVPRKDEPQRGAETGSEYQERVNGKF